MIAFEKYVRRNSTWFPQVFVCLTKMFVWFPHFFVFPRFFERLSNFIGSILLIFIETIPINRRNEAKPYWKRWNELKTFREPTNTGFPTIYWSVPMIFGAFPRFFSLTFFFRFLVRSHKLLVFSDWISIQLDQQKSEKRPKNRENAPKNMRTHQKLM